MISKVKPVVSDDEELKPWYETWFDSPFYHILYKERDEAEAEKFLDNLITQIRLSKGSKILDVACGKGRHSVYLNKKGFDVTGYDLSEQSIAHNLTLENETLHFYLHDMREVFRTNYFDVVLNLFSSFGYFDSEHDNYRCIKSHSLALKEGGLFILDFLNTALLRKFEMRDYEKTVDGINFRISKKLAGNRIIKSIAFNFQDKKYQFEEQITLFEKKDFGKFFEQAGLELIDTFGNYNLDPYEANSSDRMIFIARKTV